MAFQTHRDCFTKLVTVGKSERSNDLIEIGNRELNQTDLLARAASQLKRCGNFFFKTVPVEKPGAWIEPCEISKAFRGFLFFRHIPTCQTGDRFGFHIAQFLRFRDRAFRARNNIFDKPASSVIQAHIQDLGHRLTVSRVRKH